MNKEKRPPVEIIDLRRRAEELLIGNTVAILPPRTDEEMLLFHHELEIHQIELEMQNAQLRQSMDEVETLLEKYTDLYDFAPVGYFTLDRNEIIRAVNFTGASLLEIERSRLIGARFGQFVVQEARPAFSAFLGKLFESRDKETCEVVLKKEGMRRLHVQIEALACMSGDECRIAVIDITERRGTEEALAEKRRELDEINSTLETRIVQAVDDLLRKDRMLITQGRLAAMGEMINNIAHQWRQPLNALGLVIQQLPLFYESGEFSEEVLNDNVDKSMELIQHMSRTIDDFRNFFRSDKEMTLFRVNHVIRQTVSLIEESFKDKQTSIAFHTESDPTITGYPNEYAQVLLNILINAHDVLVERNIDDALISIHAFVEKEKTVVTITDNAGGIAEEIMGKLFEPYFTTKGPDKGTGIGLFMAQTIIEKNMGGRLTACNTRKGAEFRIVV
jgi:C4-dicarboxylate-specific signal transduction histidine kinase